MMQHFERPCVQGGSDQLTLGCFQSVGIFVTYKHHTSTMRSFCTLLLLAITLALAIGPQPVQAQSSTAGEDILNTVTTAVPFLRVAPDARAGGMADVGISVSPDPNGWFHNPAKMAFAERDLGFSVTYTPWLRQLVNDIYLASVYGFKRIDEMQTIGGSLRYFSLGNITFTNQSGQFIGDFRPNEFAIDAGYSRKLSDYFSAGTMLRFIYSNLATGQQVNGVDVRPGTSVAADIAFFYQNPDIELGDMDATLAWGVNVSNLGAKITYTADAQNRDFLPSNIGVGASLNMELDQYNQFLISVDFNKLLAPTPDTTANQAWKEQSVPAAILGSFSDAPGGFSEEIREIIWQIGAEYWYDNQFAVRAGYFFEADTKGGRNFFTVGLGLKYNVFGLNFSYLIPTTNQRNPLDNTLRFSLNFDFDALTGGQK